jgi:hypothetical protein
MPETGSICDGDRFVEPNIACQADVGGKAGGGAEFKIDLLRYGRDGLAGLDETGDRGAEPKYTAETDKRSAVSPIGFPAVRELPTFPRIMLACTSLWLANSGLSALEC